MNGSEQMGLFILFPNIHGSKTIPKIKVQIKSTITVFCTIFQALRQFQKVI